jgi:hypothetical protein
MTAKAAAAKDKRAKRAKAGKAKGRGRKAPAKPRATWHRLTWCGVRLAVRLTRNCFGYYDHLEVRVLASPEARPIPITDTGYRSHFLPIGEVEEAGGASAYLRVWLEQEACSSAYRRALARWRQLELFG